MVFKAAKLPEGASAEDIAAAYNALVDKLAVVLANIGPENLTDELKTGEVYAAEGE